MISSRVSANHFMPRMMGRPGLSPGIYFRLLLIGYFAGLDSERGIAWRAADSLTLRDFLGSRVGHPAAGSFDHFAYSTIDRPGDPSRSIYLGAPMRQDRGVGERKDDRDRCDDARSERRDAEHPPDEDSGESYDGFLTYLAKSSGMGTSRALTWRGSIGN